MQNTGYASFSEEMSIYQRTQHRVQPTGNRAAFQVCGACVASFGGVQLPSVVLEQRCSDDIVAIRLPRDQALDACG